MRWRLSILSIHETSWWLLSDERTLNWKRSLIILLITCAFLLNDHYIVNAHKVNEKMQMSLCITLSVITLYPLITVSKNRKIIKTPKLTSNRRIFFPYAIFFFYREKKCDLWNWNEKFNFFHWRIVIRSKGELNLAEVLRLDDHFKLKNCYFK